MIYLALVIAALVVAIISLHPSSPRYMLPAAVILACIALLYARF